MARHHLKVVDMGSDVETAVDDVTTRVFELKLRSKRGKLVMVFNRVHKLETLLPMGPLNQFICYTG